MRESSVQERTATLRQCLVPEYVGLDVLEIIAQEVAEAYGEHIGAVLLSSRDLDSHARTREGRLAFPSLMVTVLNDYPGFQIAGYRREFQAIADRHPIERTRVQMLSGNVNEFIMGIGTRTPCISPAVVLYISKPLQDRLG